MKHNHRVAQRVYASTYANMSEQSKIYLNSLPPEEIDEIENHFRANGNGLLSVRQMESPTEPFDCFAMFYYTNGRLPYMDGHLFVPDGETPTGIIGEKLSLKELFAKFFRLHLNNLVSSPFFAGKETLVKTFLTELYKNLTVEVLSSGNSENLQFDALTGICGELCMRLGKSIFANHKMATLHMKKQRK